MNQRIFARQIALKNMPEDMDARDEHAEQSPQVGHITGVPEFR